MVAADINRLGTSVRRWVRLRMRYGRARQMMTKAVIEAMESRILLSYVVTSLADNGSSGTLRYEIAQADTAGGNQTITFDSSLTSSGPATIELSSSLGTLELNDTSGTLTIDGPGAGLLAINGQSHIVVFSNVTTAEIDNLTITGGNGGDSAAGGVSNNGEDALSK